MGKRRFRRFIDITAGPIRGSVVFPDGTTLIPGVNVNKVCLVRIRRRWFLVVRVGAPGFLLVCPRTRFFRISRGLARDLAASGVPRCCFAVKSLDRRRCPELFTTTRRFRTTEFITTTRRRTSDVTCS